MIGIEAWRASFEARAVAPRTPVRRGEGMPSRRGLGVGSAASGLPGQAGVSLSSLLHAAGNVRLAQRAAR